jgi:L-ascorbate metabolism protein UlaG (beta-lactamase superfamily)
MSDELLYLRRDVQVEPLIDRWYAWPHLIPPATAARNLTDRHVKIMDSFINAPLVHANAAKNPRMFGGPFMDYDGTRVGDIRGLRNTTLRDRQHLVELSAALGSLDMLLRTEATGMSLHPLYPRVPDILRGYVELFYSERNHPSFRLLEPLLYKSRYYDESAQCLVLSIMSGDDRPFVLSTPRLSGRDCLTLPWRFADPRVDKLFMLKRRPRPWSLVRDELNLSSFEAEALREYLTADPPPPYQPYSGPGLRWRYFGHACILVEAAGISILCDPVLSYTYETTISRYTYDDLPDVIDYVLITHNHQDHVLFETLLQLRHRVRNIVVPRNGMGTLVDPSLKLTLENIGFSNVYELTELDARGMAPDCEVIGLPFLGEHADLGVRSKLAYLVRVRSHTLLFAADSCNIETRLYEHLHRELSDVNVLFLGMECDGAPLTWLYGPLLFEQPERRLDHSRRLNGSNFAQAVQIVDRLRCKEVFVYAMGQEPWLNYVMRTKYTEQSDPIIESNKLLAYCQDRHITAERLFGEREVFAE